MSPDTSRASAPVENSATQSDTHATPRETHEPTKPASTVVLQTDVDVTKIEITTADLVHVVRSKIIDRHILAGNLQLLTTAERVILLGLIHKGRIEEHSRGLVVRLHPAKIQRAMGLGRGGWYNAIVALKGHQWIRTWEEPDYTFQLIEVFMPPALTCPVDSSPQNDTLSAQNDTPSARRDTQSVKARAGKDLRAPEHLPDSAQNDTLSAPNDTASAQNDTQSTVWCAESPPLMQCINALQCNDAGEVKTGEKAGESEADKVKLLLGQDFDIGAAITLARNPKATLQRIRNAIAHADVATIRKSRQACITYAIKNELPPPRTKEEREQEKKPEHVQELDALTREREAAEAAAQRAGEEKLSVLTPEQLAALTQQLIDEAPNEFIRNFYEQNRATPLESILIRAGLLKLMSAIPSNATTEATV